MGSVPARIGVRLAALGLGLATGCGGPPQKSPELLAEEAAIVDLTNPSLPLPVERFQQPQAALIAPGDKLELRVLGFPELTGFYLVAQDGRVNLSLIGSIEAAGKTAEALDRDLTNAFSTYYRNLDIAVNVETRAERWVYVMGEVTKPGRIDFATGERVVHAVADAGGMTEKAREDGVILMRRETDGKDHVYRLDFSRIYQQIAPRDIYLQPGDIVFVPKSKYATFMDFSRDLVDVASRTATTFLIVDELQRRTTNISVGR